MIKNLPTSDDFKNAAFECLIQAYKNICQIDNEELSPDIKRNEIWDYHKIVLKTSIILAHQGIELLLKGKITEKSALLLIEQKKREWKTLPTSEDCEFSDLFTISGDDLIRTFYATVDLKDYERQLPKHFEDIRLLRNKMVHGIGEEEISPEIVLTMILNTFTLLNGKDSFWKALQLKFYSHPAHLEGAPKLIFDEVEQHNHIDYLEAILGRAELNKHFNVDLKARRYFCPNCTGSEGILVSDDGNVTDYPNFKFTFLIPNEPGSTQVKCLICNENFDVERTKCNKEDCKGNVIFKDLLEEDKDEETGEIYQEAPNICLTCNEIQ